ncbi:SusC/RagA family TonB-linked outer membrane protein [Zobellia uliginosa]|uniref:SusC/RagA family TonB-linked outer membrane protein n=1 Tax=Zobellia uliginosa TaxID=143224 RepID=UPI001C06C492|nr:TonB-dependent receptor [Zobellia uliginosa]MBU2945531.1 TonB-dependent receptor [Zobellia uliginosa]
MKNKLLLIRKSRLKLMTLMLGLCFGFASAQELSVTGTVSADGAPLPGVSVVVKGTQTGAVTDFDGLYTIKAKSTDVLIFSYIGFATKEIAIKGKTSLNISLEEDASELDEVIVVGYGTQRKKELTGAVVQVKSEELAKTTTSDIGTALQGQIAGVNITASSGQPGEEANILIRGFSSLLDGQNGPLYVVDGIPYNSDPQLSISEIESIDVLKDAASASIYGTRGAGGVILITTKQGKVGKMDIRVNSEYGVQDITSGTPLMSSYQLTYMDMLRGAQSSGKVQGGVNAEIHRNRSWFTNDTALEDLILNDLAPIQNHSINVSGGKDGLTYNFNASFYDQSGIMINSDYSRFNIRSNTQFTKGNWKIATGLTFKRDEKTLPNYGVFNKILEYKPFQPDIELGQTELTDVTEDDVDEPGGIGPIRALGGVARNLNTKEVRDGTSNGANIQIDFDATPSLKFTARGGANFSHDKGVRIIPRLDVYNTAGDLIPPNPWDISLIQTAVTDNNKLTFEGMMNYHKKFGKHDLNLLLVNSLEQTENEYFRAEKRDNADAAVTVFDGYTTGDLITSDGRDYTRTLIGYLGRIQYNYDGKYIFSGSIRRDGSSQFSPQNRWGWFPSASLGWNVSDEAFWEPIKETVNSFKIRVGYGTTGNDRFASYSNQAVVDLGQDYVFGSADVDPSLNSTTETPALGTTQERYANENVKWETSKERNLGVDLAFFNGKLTFSNDVYVSEKKDLLFGVVNPPSTGVFGSNRSSILNIGDMRNTGHEMALKFNHYGKKGFNWNMGLTYAKNVNLVTKTSPNNPVIFLDNSYISQRGPRELVSVIREGYEAAAFFLRETDGIIKTEEELEAYKEIDPAASLGQLRYVDQLTVDTDDDGIPDAGDGKIDQDDKVYKGSGSEDFNMGFNFGANYKGVDFSMNWYGSQGAEVMNGSKAYAYQSGTHADIYYSWTVVNPLSDIPYYDGSPNTNSYRDASDYFLEDGSFIRLRNISLGYSLPSKLTDKMKIGKLRIYVQAQNLITITNYSGFDPEVGNNGFSSRGIDQGTYPVTSQYKVGLQLQF